MNDHTTNVRMTFSALIAVLFSLALGVAGGSAVTPVFVRSVLGLCLGAAFSLDATRWGLRSMSGPSA